MCFIGCFRNFIIFFAERKYHRADTCSFTKIKVECILGGYMVARMGVMIPNDFIDGLLYYFDSYEIFYSLVKMTVFAFLITSISGFYGYYAKGNSLEVGKASTTAVVVSSIMIMLFNLLLTQLMR